jgi:hypothetical protein
VGFLKARLKSLLGVAEDDVQEEGQKTAQLCSDVDCIKSLIGSAVGSQRAAVLHFMTAAILVTHHRLHDLCNPHRPYVPLLLHCYH